MAMMSSEGVLRVSTGQDKMAAGQDKMAAGLDPSTVLNFNVGVLGHVDSGKTSLGEGSCDGHVTSLGPVLLTEGIYTHLNHWDGNFS